MVQMPLHVKKQFKMLRKIPRSKAENAPAGIIDVRIGSLEKHDAHRAIYLLSNSFAELAHKQKVIVEVIQQTQKKVEEALNDSSLSREDLELTIRELVLEEVKKDLIEDPVDE